jgi:hypothetical protein
MTGSCPTQIPARDPTFSSPAPPIFSTRWPLRCPEALAGAIVALALSVFAAPAAAQRANVQPLVRVDALVAREAAMHGAAGVSFPVARYVRIDVAVGGGIAEQPGGGTSGEARADLVGRFVLDPGFSRRWGLYGGAGIGVLAADGRTRELLLVALGAEGPRWGAVVPFAELGLGGGIRVGAGVRRALRGRR